MNQPAGADTVDTSVAVPALLAWHEAHDAARRACRPVTRLPGHVLLETVSVLTRLPHGRALDTKTAVTVVRAKFPAEPLTLHQAGYAQLTDAVAAAGLHGGQLYDALVAATAARYGMRLVSLDRRAEPTYRAIGVGFEILR